MWQHLIRRVGRSFASEWLTRVGIGRRIVLCYHDLCEPDDFTSWLRVEVGRFDEHLEALLELGSFVTPSTFEQSNTQPCDRLQFLLTFDDGYRNNLCLAADVLAKRDVPAVFFVSTHHLMTGEPFWFDRVVTRVQVARLERLDLSRFGLQEYVFHETDGARRWDDIQRLLTDLKRLGNPDEAAVARVLTFLDSEYGSIAEPYDERLRPIAVTELQQLASRPQMFFGSHGHRHEILTRLTGDDLAENLSTSKRLLEQSLNRSIEDLAYPNGDHDFRVVDACSKAGYRHGYVTVSSVVSRSQEPFTIPRLLVGGYDTARDVVASVEALLVAAAAEDMKDRVFGRCYGR